MTLNSEINLLLKDLRKENPDHSPKHPDIMAELKLFYKEERPNIVQV